MKERFEIENNNELLRSNENANSDMGSFVWLLGAFNIAIMILYATCVE